MTIKNEKDFDQDLANFDAFALALDEFWKHRDISGYSPDEFDQVCDEFNVFARDLSERM